MLIAYWRTKSSCVIRRCAANRKKNPRNIIRKYKRSKFGPHCLLTRSAALRQYIDTGRHGKGKRCVLHIYGDIAY
jgi:hypothetical protein